MRSHVVGSLALLVVFSSVAYAGIGEQGVQIQGVQIQGVQIQGVQIQGVQIQGSELTGYNGTAYLSGPQMEGAYLQAKLSNGQTVWLYVYDAKQDTSNSTLNSATYRSNSDVWLYRIMLYTDTGWTDPCPNDHYGMLMSGLWDGNGMWSSSTTQFTLACSSGVVYKCAHNWGYKPWKGMYDAYNQWHSPTAMRQLHQACVHAARAAYCANQDSFTRDGNVIDMFDNYGFNTALDEDAPQGMFGMEAYFTQNGAYQIFDETRNGDPGNVLSCNAPLYTYGNFQNKPAPGPINGSTYANLQQYLIDGAWQSPQTAYQLGLNHIGVSTSTHCSHSAGEIGAPLGYDCNTCTTAVCADEPDCCVSTPSYEGKWNARCVARAAQVCGDQLWSAPRPFFDDTYENNDTVSTPWGFSGGPLFVDGLWATGADHDFFRISSAAPVSITYDQSAGNLDLRVWQNGSIVQTSAGTTGSESVSVPSGGVVEVYGASGTANVYNLSINGYDGDDLINSFRCTYQESATRAAAPAIYNGFYAAHGICDGGSAWFKARVPMKVNISFNGLLGNLNAAAYDSSGILTGLSIGTGNLETLTVPQDGWFQVYGVSGASNQFSLSILLNGGTNYLEGGATTEPWLFNEISPAGNVDTITAPYAGTAVVSFDNDRGDLNIASYDRNGGLIGLSLGTGDAESVHVVTGGTVRVWGASGVTNAYSIAFLR